MHDAGSLEALGVPTAAIVTEAFLNEARAQLAAMGMETLQPVVVPHPLSTLSDEEITGRAREAAPLVVKTLLRDG